jgi:predicted transcriptional regulator of viral defense system
MNPQANNRAASIFSDHGGILTTSQALRFGISPRTLYAMRDSGMLRQLNRGVFQLAEMDLTGNPDLVVVSKRIPRAVICLISALHFHGLTSQIPHQVYIALPQSAEKPRIDFPPLDIIWLSEKIYSAGILEQTIDGVPINIYSMEKTVADCFKFRNKIGNDTAMEALKEYLKMPHRELDLLISYARMDRVETLTTRYLEALL